MAGYRFDSNGLPEKTPHSATHFEVVAVREFGARACRDSSTYFLPIQGRYEASSAMQFRVGRRGLASGKNLIQHKRIDSKTP